MNLINGVHFAIHTLFVLANERIVGGLLYFFLSTRRLMIMDIFIVVLILYGDKYF